MTSQDISDDLKVKVSRLSKYAWGNLIKDKHVNSWLNNFEDNEKIHMYYLLGKFMYFGSKEIKELLVALYRDKIKYKFVEKIRKDNNFTVDAEFIENELSKRVSLSRFFAVGNASESGHHILYPFRQLNNLKTSQFRETARIFENSRLTEPEVENYFFIDDFCGSGSQGNQYTNELVKHIKRENPNAQITYCVLFGMTGGLSTIREKTKFDNVVAVCELDNSFKCFENDSRFYNDPPDSIAKEHANKIALYHGTDLVKNLPNNMHLFPLGWRNCQLLVSFEHNTPDNTLPIFWAKGDQEKNWNPIFTRHDKAY